MGARRNDGCATRGLCIRSIIRPLVSGAVLAPSNRMAEDLTPAQEQDEIKEALPVQSTGTATGVVSCNRIGV